MIDKESLDQELIREIASVGGEYGSRLERLIGDLNRLRRSLLYLRSRIERERGTPLYSMRLLIRLRRRFEDKKKEALEVRKYLIIYREALGLLKHEEVFEVYNIEAIDV